MPAGPKILREPNLSSTKFILSNLLLFWATLFGVAGAINDGMTGYFWAIPFYLVLAACAILPYCLWYQRVYSAAVLIFCIVLIQIVPTNSFFYPVIGRTITTAIPFDIIRYKKSFMIGDNSVPTFEDERLKSLYFPPKNVEPFPMPEYRATVPAGLTFEAFKVVWEDSLEGQGKFSIYFRNDQIAFRVERKTFPEFRAHLKEANWLTEMVLCQRELAARLSNLMYYPWIFVGKYPPMGQCPNP